MSREQEAARAAIRREWRRLRRVVRWARRSYLVVIVLGIVIGLQIAPVVAHWAAAPVSGTVVVIPIEGGIDGPNAASVVNQLERARSDPAIEAVVLRVNSPGGSAAASETIYLAVKRTASEIPVVVSVDSMAASGGYYASVPADAIYVKPASLIGSVGVFFVSPQPVAPLDQLITTGPDKLTGADRREWFYKTEAIRRAFSGAVVANRGDRLKLTESELAHAKLYTGAEAVGNGVADEIGGLEDAVARAVDLAELSQYRVRTLPRAGTVTFITRSNYVASAATDKQLRSPAYFLGSPSETAVPTVLLLPPSVVRAAVADREVSRPNVTATAAAG